MRRYRATSVMVTLLVSLWCAAGSANPHVDAARGAYEEGDYASALVHLKEAAREATLSEQELVDMHFYRAATHLALRQRAKAEAAFDDLIAIRPLHNPGKLAASPAVLAVLRQRQAAWQMVNGVDLGEPVIEFPEVRVPITRNATTVDAVYALVRAAGENAFQPFRLDVEEGVARGKIDDVAFWERVKAGGKVELAFEARNLRHAAVARIADASKPISVDVTVAQLDAILEALAPPPPPEPPPPAATEPAPILPDVVPVPPPPVVPKTAGPLAIAGRVASGALLAATAVLAGVTVLLAGAATGAYAGTWLHPAYEGAETTLSYRALYYGWISTMGGGLAVALLAGIVLVAAAGVGVLGWLVL